MELSGALVLVQQNAHKRGLNILSVQKKQWLCGWNALLAQQREPLRRMESQNHEQAFTPNAVPNDAPKDPKGSPKSLHMVQNIYVFIQF